MPTAPTITTAAVALLAVAGTLAAQPAPPATAVKPVPTVTGHAPRAASGPNAALAYYSIWATWVPDDTTIVTNTVNDVQPGKALPQDLHRVLESNKAGIARLVKAASYPRCDFELDYSEGFDLLMTHLPKLRSSARLLVADAKRCLAAGEFDAAADRYAAVFGLAAHASGDRVLISGLVSSAIASLACGDLLDGKAAQMLSPQGRAKVRAAIERLLTDDPFGLKAAVEGERDLALASLLTKYDGPDAGKRLVDEVFVPLTGGALSGKLLQEELNRVRTMDHNGVSAEVRKLTPYYNEVLRIWDATDAKKKLEDLNQRVEQGEFGALGTIILPAFGKCKVSQIRAAETLRATLKALEEHTPWPNRP